MMEVIIDGKKVMCKEVKVNLVKKIEGQHLGLTVSVDKNKVTVDDGDMSTDISYESLYV